MKRTRKASPRTRSAGASASLGNPMAEQVGPEFHDETGARMALAPAGEELLASGAWAQLCEARGVLAVAAFDGTRMFPAWQFVDGAVLDGLGDVVAAMAGQPAWSVALWICTSHDDLGGKSPRQVLQAGEASRALVELAAETARRWS